MSDHLFFSTDPLPPRDRFPAFCEEFVRRRTALDIVQRGEEQFRGMMDLQRAGPVVVGSHFSTPIDLVRSPRLVRDGDDSLLVTLCRRGDVCLSQRGGEQRIEPGYAFVCDSGYPGEVRIFADTSLSLVRIPRSAAAKMLPQADWAAARLDRDDVALRLLFGYLGGTLDVRPENGGQAMRLHGEHVLDLIALAQGAGGEARELAEHRSMRAVRRAAILKKIETGAPDPRLSAASVAGDLGVTPRYVRLLLEETGRSFSEHVLDKRLELVATLLRDRRQQGRKIADIAYRCGFSDLSYFNRTFRRRYGETPSEMREVTLRRDGD